MIIENFQDKHLLKLSLKKNFYKKKINCEVCNSRNFSSLQNIGRIGRPGEYGLLNTVICLNCSFKYLNPRYNDAFYKSYYKKNYRKIAFGDYKPSKKYIKQQISRGQGVYNCFKNFLPKTGKILDHGCASGATMIAWIKNGWNALGIDPHEPSVKFGKQNLNLEIKKAFGEKLPFKRKNFDVVLSLGSLEHSYDLNKSLSQISKILKTDGKLIIRWRSDEIIGSPLEYYNHNHNRFFNKHTWRLVLKKHGFHKVRFTKKKPEGYISYKYIIASKSIKIFKKLNFKNLAQVKKEISYHKKVEQKYFKFAKIYEKNFKNKFDLKKKKYFIKRYKIKLLGIRKEEAIKRFFLELKSFLKFIKYYNIEKN
jgi:SAM-dependent methyltransferase